MEIARDALVATSVGICGKKIYQKVKNLYYHKEDIDINDVHIEFIPQATGDEMIIITRKCKEPELCKYFSTIN